MKCYGEKEVRIKDEHVPKGTPKAEVAKAEINQWDSIKLKSSAQ